MSYGPDFSLLVSAYQNYSASVRSESASLFDASTNVIGNTLKISDMMYARKKAAEKEAILKRTMIDTPDGPQDAYTLSMVGGPDVFGSVYKMAQTKEAILTLQMKQAAALAGKNAVDESNAGVDPYLGAEHASNEMAKTVAAESTAVAGQIQLQEAAATQAQGAGAQAPGVQAPGVQAPGVQAPGAPVGSNLNGPLLEGPPSPNGANRGLIAQPKELDGSVEYFRVLTTTLLRGAELAKQAARDQYVQDFHGGKFFDPTKVGVTKNSHSPAPSSSTPGGGSWLEGAFDRGFTGEPVVPSGRFFNPTKVGVTKNSHSPAPSYSTPGGGSWLEGAFDRGFTGEPVVPSGRFFNPTRVGVTKNSHSPAPSYSTPGGGSWLEGAFDRGFTGEPVVPSGRFFNPTRVGVTKNSHSPAPSYSTPGGGSWLEGAFGRGFSGTNSAGVQPIPVIPTVHKGQF